MTNIVKREGPRASPANVGLVLEFTLRTRNMPCEQCASTCQQDFQGEFTVAFTGLNLALVYVRQKTPNTPLVFRHN